MIGQSKISESNHLSAFIIPLISALYVVIYGSAQCKWSETREIHERSNGTRTNTRYETIYYTGKDVYLNTKKFLFGSYSSESVEILGGIHRYNFAFPLPPMLPTTFEAPQGSIRYNIEAVLEVPWGFNRRSKLPLNVVHHENLNLQPELKHPIESEESKRFCCLFCKSQPLMMTVTLPCSGFAQGQSIAVTVGYVNQSNVKVE